MIENKLVKGNIEGNCERNIGKQKFKEKHKCDKSNFLTIILAVIQHFASSTKMT